MVDRQDLHDPLTRFDMIRDRVGQIMQKQIVFVLGCQKSGTTWLQRLLDGHRDVRCNGEAYFGAVLLPALAQAIEVYNKAQKIGPECQFRHDDVKHLFQTAVGLMFGRWLGDEDVSCIGEKTPENSLCIEHLNAAFPDAKFIHIVRDPRDVTVSGWFHNLRQNEAPFRQRFPSMARYASYVVREHWIAYIERVQAFGTRYPRRYFELRYEDLWANTTPLITGMLRFLDVEASAEAVAQCQVAGSFEKLTNGRPRGEEDRNSCFRKGVIGDWKSQLDQETLDTIAHLAGPLLRQLGYDMTQAPGQKRSA